MRSKSTRVSDICSERAVAAKLKNTKAQKKKAESRKYKGPKIMESSRTKLGSFILVGGMKIEKEAENVWMMMMMMLLLLLSIISGW